MFPRSITLLLCCLLFGVVANTHAAQSQSLHDVRVVIDVGHGGDDWGFTTARDGLYEKDFVLRIAQRMQQQLHARGARVYLTRADDAFVSLNARVRFANALL